MAYSFTEKKRIRKDFGRRSSILEVPFLLATQIESYKGFLQADTLPLLTAEYGVDASLEGRAKRQRDTMADLKLGMQVGMDVARGPEDTSIYLTVGSAW